MQTGSRGCPKVSVCADSLRPQDSAQAQQFTGVCARLQCWALMITHLGMQKVS